MVKPLPVEILQSIFDFVATANQIQASLPPLDHANYLEGLQEQQTLVAAARVCRQWTKAADRSLYRHILVCDPDKASGVLRKVQWHSELADGVRTLRFFCLKPLHRSGQVNIKLLFRRLPKLRNYSIDTTRFPDTYCAEVVPTHKHVPNLERLDVLARHYLPGDDALHSRLPVSPLPRRLKRLQLRGLDLANIDVFKLPHLDYLALDCLAQESMKAGVFGGSTRLKHLVLNDPDRPGAGMVIRQLGHQLETLELNYDDQMNQDVLPIERDTMKPLSNLVSFALRGDFFESEIPHIPQTIRYFCWRGATDSEAINAFLATLCDPMYLPNLVEFPIIYMPEEARYRYPSVRKVAIKKATNALMARKLKPVYREMPSLWNEKMIFPRIERN